MAQKPSLATNKIVKPIETKAGGTSSQAGKTSSSQSHSTLQKDLLNDRQNDYFVKHDGQTYAGGHVLVDLWGAKNLTDQDLMERALRAAADACEATILHMHLHRFNNGGISGVAVLAESHISVHTWPERHFAAFDIFMCGNCKPENALPVLCDFFSPDDMQVNTYRRGLVT